MPIYIIYPQCTHLNNSEPTSLNFDFDELTFSKMHFLDNRKNSSF